MKKTAVLLVCVAAALTLAAGCKNTGAPAVTTVFTTAKTTAPMTTAPIITTFTTPAETTVVTETEPGATS